MTVSRTVDVAVVGNGVLGLSIAFELVRRAPDVRVAVVGPPERELAASVAAGAMLNCFGEVTRATAAHPAALAKFAIARQALEEWPEWLASLHDAAGPPDDDGLRSAHLAGTFVLLGSRSGPIGADNFEAMCAAAALHDEPHELVDPREIDGLAPRTDARPLRALYLAREGAVDARSLLADLDDAARALGVTAVPTTARELLAGSGGISGVRLADGDMLSAGTVVLAAGAASGDLAAGVLPPGAVPPMLHGTGVALLVTRTTTSGPGARCVLRTPNRAATCGLHVVPLGRPGEQYLGATNLITSRPVCGGELGSAHALMRHVCEQVDHALAFSRVRRWLAGSRPIPLDCFPLLGGCSVRGLVFATGTYRDGLHCSPAIARHLVGTMLGEPEDDPHFAPFRPERLPIETMPAQEAIDETARHAVDVTSEQGLNLPFWLDGTLVEEWVRGRTRRLYESLGAPVALAPEIVIPQFLARKASDEGGDTSGLRRYLLAARGHHG